MMNIHKGATDPAAIRNAAALHAIADGILAGIILVPDSVDVWHHDLDPGSAQRLLQLAHDYDERIRLYPTHAGITVKPFDDVSLTMRYISTEMDESSRAAYDVHNRICRAPAGARYWMAAEDSTIQP